LKACKKCRRILKKDEIEEMVKENPSIRCPICKSTDLSEDFSGHVIIVDPENSEIAEKLGVTLPGNYALRVR